MPAPRTPPAFIVRLRALLRASVPLLIDSDVEERGIVRVVDSRVTRIRRGVALLDR